MWRAFLIGAALSLAAVGAAEAKSPPRDILGLRLGMGEAEAHRRLARLGKEAGYEPAKLERNKELWEVRDGRIASVAVKFDDQHRVSWITAFSRPEGKRLRYRDLGDLEKAERQGYYIYMWKVPARGESRAYAVMARGSDPEKLGNYALFYPPTPGTSEEEREESD